LIKLIGTAKGTEKNPLLAAVSALIGHQVSEEEASELAHQINRDETIAREFDDWQRLPNLDRFFAAARIITGAKAEVDESLPLILELWIQWGMRHPEHARQYFQDAARFLKVGFEGSPVFDYDEGAPIPPQVSSSNQGQLAPSAQSIQPSKVKQDVSVKRSKRKSA
jgi:hypothetical protein